MRISKVKKSIMLMLALLVLLVSCDPKRVFEDNKILEKGIWNVNNQLQFEVPILDQTARYNIYFNVRNAPEYPYSNLYLFLTTRIPDGHITRDTIELTLADFDGRWLGSGMGSTKYSRFLFEKGVRFKQKGSYLFTIEQAMRVNQLAGIRDFGLRVEKE